MYLQVKHTKGQQSQFMKKKKRLMAAIYNALVKIQLFPNSFMSRNAHHTYNAQWEFQVSVQVCYSRNAYLKQVILD